MMFWLLLWAGFAVSTCAQSSDQPKSEPTPNKDWLVASDLPNSRVIQAADGREVTLTNGLIRRTWRLSPNAACVAFDNLMTGQSMLRSVRPEARVTIDGKAWDVGGLIGQPNHAYLTPVWLDAMTSDPAALQFRGLSVGKPQERIAWQRVRHHSPNVTWPPKGVSLRLDFGTAEFRVSVHYEMYDGVPLLCKWIRVQNQSNETIQVDKFCAEELAVVEHSNWVETRKGVPQQVPNFLHVETDMAFGGFQSSNANRHVVHWRSDPLYMTQVNWKRQTPCLLVVEPTYGPAQAIAPTGVFESFKVFELILDSTDRERVGLAQRRMYRTIAPWVTENPLMHHLLANDPMVVRKAIDHAVEVGFEMIILSFGSGFNIENDSPDFLASWKSVADYAQKKGIDLGCYSLLSSRKIGGGNDVVSPAGEKPTHGSCPALTSEWGTKYYAKLYHFFRTTGLDMLEHDGPYPGDVDVTPRPPLQKGKEDSRWVQWRIASDFYAWCRKKGIYLNAPDFYYLSGSNKCGMGYREVNWSLPRAQQVIHTRQNIYDGTWRKTPSMGWMFVPLTEYHGGGAEATIEPLDEHLDHYENMLISNLGMGVQACYRGPRLFDTPRTRDMLKAKVAWFKKYRDILESDMIHGRRADGRDLDWMLHANPTLPDKGMLVVFNPLKESVKKTIRVNLYFTGLTTSAKVSAGESKAEAYEIARDYSIDLPVVVPGGGMRWYVIR